MKRNYKFYILSLLAIFSLGISSCQNSTIKGDTGEKGDTGLVGDKGETGDKGDKGEDGIDGEDGSLWLSGEGKPSSNLGKDTDLYLDTLNGDVYQKANGSWSLIYNAKGEDGNDGTNGNNGLNGNDGEMYYSNTILPSNDGTIVPSLGSQKEGEDITFTFIPNDIYDSKLNIEWEITSKDGKKTTYNGYSITLKMVEGGYIVSAKVIKEKENHYVVIDNIDLGRISPSVYYAKEGETISLTFINYSTNFNYEWLINGNRYPMEFSDVDETSATLEIAMPNEDLHVSVVSSVKDNQLLNSSNIIGGKVTLDEEYKNETYFLSLGEGDYYLEEFDFINDNIPSYIYISGLDDNLTRIHVKSNTIFDEGILVYISHAEIIFDSNESPFDDSLFVLDNKDLELYFYGVRFVGDELSNLDSLFKIRNAYSLHVGESKNNDKISTLVKQEYIPHSEDGFFPSLKFLTINNSEFNLGNEFIHLTTPDGTYLELSNLEIKLDRNVSSPIVLEFYDLGTIREFYEINPGEYEESVDSIFSDYDICINNVYFFSDFIHPFDCLISFLYPYEGIDESGSPYYKINEFEKYPPDYVDYEYIYSYSTVSDIEFSNVYVGSENSYTKITRDNCYTGLTYNEELKEYQYIFNNTSLYNIYAINKTQQGKIISFSRQFNVYEVENYQDSSITIPVGNTILYDENMLKIDDRPNFGWREYDKENIEFREFMYDFCSYYFDHIKLVENKDNIMKYEINGLIDWLYDNKNNHLTIDSFKDQDLLVTLFSDFDLQSPLDDKILMFNDYDAIYDALEVTINDSIKLDCSLPEDMVDSPQICFNFPIKQFYDLTYPLKGTGEGFTLKISLDVNCFEINEEGDIEKKVVKFYKIFEIK